MELFLKLHSQLDNSSLIGIFEKILKEDFDIFEFSILLYSESSFSYSVVYSTCFKEDEFFFDAEIERDPVFELGGKDVYLNIESEFEGTKFRFLSHSENSNKSEIEKLFSHFVVAYKKNSLLSYYQSTIVSSKLQLDFLNEIGDILGNFDINIILPKILENSINLVDGDVGAIFLEKEGVLSSKISWGIPDGVVENIINVDSNRTIIDECFSKKETIFIEDFSSNMEYEFHLKDKYLLNSIIALPLYTKNKNLGVVVLVNFKFDIDFSDTKLPTLETLAKISAISIENAIFFKDSIEKEKLNTQIKIAAELQKSLLPNEDIITERVMISGTSIPAMNVGGDFYHYKKSDDEKKFICFLGDVAGKGIPASLLTSMAMILIKTLSDFSSPLGDDISKINDIITKENLGERYFTLGIFKIDSELKDIEILNAGHTEILVFNPEKGKFSEFSSNNLPIGMFEGVEFVSVKKKLSAGDLIITFSDGIPDAVNEKEERYELERLKKVVSENHNLSPSELKDVIIEDVKRFCGNTEQFDDLTLLIVKIVK